MFSDQLKDQLIKEFEKLIDPVVLVLHKDSSELSQQTEKMLAQISNLSEKITVKTSDSLQCYGYPCISVQTKEKDFGIRFMGKPDGGEFQPFIKTILMVSRNEYDLTERTAEFLEELDRPVEIKIFVTKGCGWCPPVMLKIYSFALVSDYITATAIDCYTFSDLAMKHSVSAVPKVVINDKKEFVGPKEENDILGYIFGAVS